MLEELFVEINVNDYLERHGIKEDKDLKITEKRISTFARFSEIAC